jgi:hypothetical protein
MLELTKNIAVMYTLAVAEDCKSMVNIVASGEQNPDWIRDKNSWSAMADNMDEVANYLETFKANAEWSAIAAIKTIAEDSGFNLLSEESKKLIKIALEESNVKMAESTKI